MLMERQHLTGQRLDKTMSERTLKTFIKDLDPLKLFFLQSDIDEFQQMNKENSIGDMHQARRRARLPTTSFRAFWPASMNASRWPKPT